MQLNGHTFLITGGASGLGAATATNLVQHGATVTIADLNAEAGVALAQALGDAATFVRTDVTDEASVQNAIETTLTTTGALHGAVNCAGIAEAGRTVGRAGPHPLDSFIRVITVNLVGAFNVARLAAAVLAQNAPLPTGERGVIVQTTSIAAYDGQIGQVAYAASKGAIVSMTLPMARDLAELGIRVVTIAPGIFDTPLLGALPDVMRAALAERVPFPSRLGQPAEFAALVAHILENPMLNGEVIRLDGALRMPPK